MAAANHLQPLEHLWGSQCPRGFDLQLVLHWNGPNWSVAVPFGNWLREDEIKTPVPMSNESPLYKKVSDKILFEISNKGSRGCSLRKVAGDSESRHLLGTQENQNDIKTPTHCPTMAVWLGSWLRVKCIGYTWRGIELAPSIHIAARNSL